MSPTRADFFAAADRVALVTGGTGFVGTHLLKRLYKEGWQVHALVRPESLRKAEAQDGTVTWHAHDGSTEGMLAILKAVRPKVVFHLASLFLAQHRPTDVESLIASNVLFGTQLLEGMAQSGVRYLVNTGTSWQSYENEGYNPVCLYAATKQAFEDLARYYVEACGVRMITLRLFDTYGPEDPRPKLIALLQRALTTGETLEMSPGEQQIDLVFIDDVVEAFLIAAERLVMGAAAGSEVYAVSSGKPMTLRQFVARFSEVAGQAVKVNWGGRPYRPREVMRPWAGGKPLPGWSIRVGIEEGLRRTLEGCPKC